MKGSIGQVLLDFVVFCDQRRMRVVESLFMMVPFAGQALANMLKPDERDVPTIVTAMNQSLSDRLGEVAELLAAQMAAAPPPPPRYIVTVGAGYAEHLLSPYNPDTRRPLDISLGHKHMVECAPSMGGSGVNYALRLLHAQYPVLPIPGLGNDDTGKSIKDTMLELAADLPGADTIAAFVSAPGFFLPQKTTPRSTILMEGPRRTIFTEPTPNREVFQEHLNERLEWICQHVGKENIAAVLIGHISADGEAKVRKGGQKPATCTSQLIECFHRHSLLYANFGASQIELGLSFWEEDLRHLDVFQLHIHEMRKLFRRRRNASLHSMLKWFSARGISVVITLDRLGAIAHYRKGEEGMVLAWPFKLNDFKDPTGAGDAFGAGLVSRLCARKEFGPGEFQDAVREARVWAAHACTTFGGASECPDRAALARLGRSLRAHEPFPVESQAVMGMDKFLYMIDRAFE